MSVEQESSYQANTVEELRDELRARDLHTSGNKDELVARLEEDDAAGVGTEEAPAPEATAGVAAPVDPYATVYSPYELPAATEAAQAFVNANPAAVDNSLTLDEQRMTQAQEAIQTYGAEDDPRLSGGDITPQETAVVPELEAGVEPDTSETEAEPEGEE
jgi:hypothetical protein